MMKFKQLQHGKRAAVAWIRGLSRPQQIGLMCTFGISVALVLVAGFVSIAKDVLLLEDLARIDSTILGLIQEYRTTGATVFFRIITNLVGIEAVAIGLAVLMIAAWRTKFLPLLFGLAVLVGVAITQILKVLFGRLRPEEAFRLVVENGFSFPSGHTFLATLLFGLGGYVLARSAATRLGMWAAGGVAALFILLVGFSRMYLGVHYPSDVLASFLFASALVTVSVTLIEINQRFAFRPDLRVPGTAARPLMTALAAMSLVAVCLVILA